MAIGSSQVWGKIKGFITELFSDKVRMKRIKLYSDPIKTIIEIVDYSATVPGTVKIKTSTAHGLSTLDYITVTNTTDYNATYQITKIDADEFYVTATYVADETSGYLHSVYATGGQSYDLCETYGFTEASTDVILDPDANYTYVYDKTNNKIIFKVTNTQAELAANTGIASKTIYGTLIGK